MKMQSIFNFPEITDLPSIYTMISGMKFGMETANKVLKEPTGLSDEVIYRLRNFKEAYDNLIKVCVPEGCSI